MNTKIRLPEQLRSPIHWTIKAFRPMQAPTAESVRAWAIALVLRIMLHLGYVVLLIGVARSGKTFLLARTTPGRILDESGYWQRSTQQPSFDVSCLPESPFAIDEAMAFEQRSLTAGIAQLKNRGFVIALQQIEDLSRSGIATALAGKRVMVVQLQTAGLPVKKPNAEAEPLAAHGTDK